MSIIAYDAGKVDGKEELLVAVLDIINEFAKDPPMRGDVAISDLRREIEKLK